MKPSHLEEDKRLEEYNRQAIEDHTREYLPVRYVELILFDIVPVDRRDELVSAVRNLAVENDENVSWIEKGRVGTLGGGWNVYFSIDGHKLPKKFESARAVVGQRFGFDYYFLCSVVIAEDTESLIKERYMRSGLWSISRKPKSDSIAAFSRSVSDRESTILRIQQELEDLLSNVPGIFLSRPRTSEDRVRCPSVRVLETSQFEIGDGFESWFRQHGDFLRFLEVWPAVSTFRDVVFSYQSGKLDNSDLPSGFVFVKLATADLKVDFPVDSLSFTEEYMTPFLLTLYWCRAKLEFEIPTQERSIELLNGKFRGLLTQRLSIWERFTRLMRRRSSILASIIALYNETVDVGNSFETFALGELKRLGEMQGSYHLKSSNMPQSRPLEVAGFKVDILNDITKSVRFISDEANSLKGLRRKVRSLTSQYKSYSEFALQKDMMRLTKGALFIGLASLLIALLALLLRVF